MDLIRTTKYIKRFLIVGFYISFYRKNFGGKQHFKIANEKYLIIKMKSDVNYVQK